MIKLSVSIPSSIYLAIRQLFDKGLLAENQIDAKFYELVAEYLYVKKKNFGKLIIKLTKACGGGTTTADEYKEIQVKKTDYVFVSLIVEWYSYGGHLEKRVIETKLLEVRYDNKEEELFEAI